MKNIFIFGFLFHLFFFSMLFIIKSINNDHKLLNNFKTIIKIESCANSGRCRVIFDDNSTDLVFNAYIGMKVKK